jgi:RNA polymerase sigma-70 factor (ECF subfamily)
VTETAAEVRRPAELVAKIAAGDRGAEEQVVSLYGRSVAILLDRHTSGRPEAEDLFQDTFRVALEKLRRGELREPEKLPGFLAQIARNLAIEHYRKAARRRTEPDSEAVAAAPAAAAGQLAEVLARENAALVRRTIADLANDRDREILLRFYLAEEDKDAIAADHGLSGLQFNRVLHRARQRYRELLAARLEQDGVRLRTAVVLLVALAASTALPATPRLAAPLTAWTFSGPRG